MQVCSTLASEMRILCIRKQLTSDPCYGPLYYEMLVLIDNLCLRLFHAYGLLVISLDDSVEANLMIWEAPGQCGIRASTQRGGGYGMNMIEGVSKKGIHISMDTPEPTSQPITLTSALSLPRSRKKTDSHKIMYLCEIFLYLTLNLLYIKKFYVAIFCSS